MIGPFIEPMRCPAGPSLSRRPFQETAMIVGAAIGIFTFCIAFDIPAPAAGAIALVAGAMTYIALGAA